MKRGLPIILFISIFLITISFVAAAQNVSEEDSKVNKARNCLTNKIGDCSSLSVEDEIFSLLSVGKCKDALISDSDNSNCWPKGACDLTTTAKATLALHKTGNLVSNSKDWLLSNNMSTTNLNWFLQIETSGATSCDISYDGYSGTININDDKKFISSAGNCLQKTSDGYWLRVPSSCYGKPLTISCGGEDSFKTNLLYQRQDSSTIYVSEKINVASPGASVTEKVDSSCFSQAIYCDFEGSLWSVLVLDSLGMDMSAYLPYLVTGADDITNRKYLAEAFLQILTEDYREELLSKQKTVNNYNYWEESGNKYYDTALALYPFQYSEPIEKKNAKTWLLSEDIQGSDGCWDSGNIRSTAFLLYSIWPGDATKGSGGVDCETSGNYCMSSMSCNNIGGILKEGYNCDGAFICCTEKLVLQTCSEQNGRVCDSDETCTDGEEVSAFGLESGETCCLGGTCEKAEEVSHSECENADGKCRTFECKSDERETSEDCDFSNEVCCFPKIKNEKNYAGVVILILLIILVVLGIIFRKKLRTLFLKIKSKLKGMKERRKGKGKSEPGQGPGFPRGPPSSGVPLMRTTPRRILPPTTRTTARPLPRTRSSSDVDDILKKLKEMSK